MQYTEHYNLKKPEGNSAVDIEDLNENADIVDTELKKKADEIVVNNSLDNKVDKVADKGLSTNDYSNLEKQKVADNESNLESHLADYATLKTGFENHKAEEISQTINISRNLSLVGSQTISTLPNKKIKNIEGVGIVPGTKKISFARWSPRGGSRQVHTTEDTGSFYEGVQFLMFAERNAVNNRTIVEISNATKGSFDLNFTEGKATGTAFMQLTVLYHGE